VVEVVVVAVVLAVAAAVVVVAVAIPESTLILGTKMFTSMQWTTMPLRFLVFHIVVAMASKKRVVVLDLNTNVKVIKASEKTSCQ
jgi:hypothetical protein